MTSSNEALEPGQAATDAGGLARQAADRLLAAARHRMPRAAIGDVLGATDMDAGYAIQHLLTQDAVAGGRQPIGRTMGLTAEAVQRQLGVDRLDSGCCSTILHLHIFLAPVNVLFSRLPNAVGALEPMRSNGKVLDFEEADPDADVFGLGKIEDFPWKGLLDVATSACAPRSARFPGGA